MLIVEQRSTVRANTDLRLKHTRLGAGFVRPDNNPYGLCCQLYGRDVEAPLAPRSRGTHGASNGCGSHRT
jgi:hypothetical protein